MRILIFFFFCSIASARNCTPFKNPQGKDIKDVIEKYEESPFLVACKKPPDILKGRPRTGLFTRSVVEKDSDGRTTRDFLKKVITKARTRVQEGFHQIDNVSKCMNRKTEECAELNTWIDKELPEYIKATRYNLSLAQSPHQMKTWFSEASIYINDSLSPLGSYKFEDWAPLTKEEKDRAELDLNDYKKQIDSELVNLRAQKKLSLLGVNDFKNQSLLAVRYKHYLAYHQMMSELPLLQYLKDANVTREKLRTAFEKMNKNLLAENNHLNELEAQLNTPGPLSTDVLELLNYSSIVEELLIEDNQDCKLASSLVFTMSNRQIGNSIAVGLPILAISFFAPPMVGLLAGLGVGSGFAYKSYSEFSSAQQRSLGFIYGDSFGADLKSLDHAASQKNYDIVTMPVGFGLAGLVGKSLAIGGRSLVMGNKIFKSYKN